ncbi:MAG: bifunctional molybdenum cofactor biosynthesis protein MoaC/MoaB [Deltaproteobacteria bacterium RIFCSPLOWO2_02_FULL_50_16]|nr:MAG: bifunctional molybdenum cofactor biosynthesis protein MoaC/MoaB [Deltaproteobacteria bacterium RIFCSPLOWO2_02_FULL_50_16]OGQ67505.1 MAG: bifunctional molybdenum cofactor biosynthesis protein MoaC/MoaB [Deltaproteobacteria bacterium RIFCSPLOWO2_12_FULL_50_11]
MISTENKIMTLRRAKAQAVLRATPQLIDILKSRKGPKGDALEVAKTAGILGAKRTWEIIPYCHPLPLDQVTIDYEIHEDRVVIIAQATAVWKTGIEMEALVAAQIAATTLFDMLKPVDNNMEIGEIKILEKTGGKSSFKEELPRDFKVAVIVTSDGTFQGIRRDKSGQIIREKLAGFGIVDCEYLVLPDEKEKIRQALLGFYEKRFHLVITTGGTGLGPRDVTVEATQEVIDRVVPGIMEAARSFGQQRTPYSMLSRGLAGLKGQMLIVNLPGSSRGAQESLEAIFPGLLHSYKMMAGGGH